MTSVIQIKKKKLQFLRHFTEKLTIFADTNYKYNMNCNTKNEYG